MNKSKIFKTATRSLGISFGIVTLGFLSSIIVVFGFCFIQQKSIVFPFHILEIVTLMEGDGFNTTLHFSDSLFLYLIGAFIILSVLIFILIYGISSRKGYNLSEKKDN